MKNVAKPSQDLPYNRCGMREHIAIMDFDKAMKELFLMSEIRPRNFEGKAQMPMCCGRG
jgi:hypothetical protein